jgi:hypothetical protein
MPIMQEGPLRAARAHVKLTMEREITALPLGPPGRGEVSARGRNARRFIAPCMAHLFSGRSVSSSNSGSLLHTQKVRN